MECFLIQFVRFDGEQPIRLIKDGHFSGTLYAFLKSCSEKLCSDTSLGLVPTGFSLGYCLVVVVIQDTIADNEPSAVMEHLALGRNSHELLLPKHCIPLAGPEVISKTTGSKTTGHIYQTTGTTRACWEVFSSQIPQLSAE